MATKAPTKTARMAPAKKASATKALAPEIEMQLRQIALSMAHGSTADKIVADATKFLAFLKG